MLLSILISILWVACGAAAWWYVIDKTLKITGSVTLIDALMLIPCAILAPLTVPMVILILGSDIVVYRRK